MRRYIRPGASRQSRGPVVAPCPRRGALLGVGVQRKNELMAPISRKHLSRSDGKVSSL
jgi:hypothetical protein